MEVRPPYLFGSGAGASVSATYDVDAATIEMKVLGRWSSRLAADTYAGFRKCLAEHPTAIIMNLHRLTDPHAASAAMWLTAGATARGMQPPVRIALNLPTTEPLAHRLRHIGLTRSVPMYATAAEARTAVADRLQLVRLPGEAGSARIARGLVDLACAAWHLPDLQHPARLVLSELVANAIEHTGTEMIVAVSRRPAGLRLSVHDRDPRLPRPTEHHGPGGRGLRIVDTLSAAWGAMPTPDGKTVWATMRSHRRRRRTDRDWG